MKCPKCSGAVEPWGLMEYGGYRGVECPKCGVQWWSEAFENASHDAHQKAIDRLMVEMATPGDLLTHEEWSAKMEKEADEADEHAGRRHADH